jgi:hypothetical protein
VVLINICAFSCLYMGYFVPALNGPCSCPPMGRDLGPNLARYDGSCRAWAVLFSVLRAGPPDLAQMYTYTREREIACSPFGQGSSNVSLLLINAFNCDINPFKFNYLTKMYITGL